MSKVINQKTFFIFLCILISITLISFAKKKSSGRKFLETIFLENISSIEISSREKKISSNDDDLINELKCVIQKLAVEKDDSSKMKREIRNVYIISFEKDKNLYEIHISYPNSREYVYVYLESKKYSTHFCCELQEEDWITFMHFINNCNQLLD